MPERLMSLHRGKFNDDKLYWTTFNGSFWTGDAEFSNGARSKSCPAVTIFNGTLYCVHRGKDDDDKLWYCTFDPATEKWSEDHEFEADNRSSDGPAIAAFKGSLYCVHKGKDHDQTLYWCVFDPVVREWSPDTPFSNGNQTNAPPALINVNDQTLYCVHRGNEKNDHLWFTTFDASSQIWYSDTEFLQGNLSYRGVGLAYYDSKVFCAHRGQSARLGTKNLWWCYLDGANWTTDFEFTNGNQSVDGPALCVYQGTLYCVHRGTDDNDHLFYSKLNGSGPTDWVWSTDTIFHGENRSTDGPALIVVNFP